MSTSSNDTRLQQARQLDDASTALARIGVEIVKKHPVISTSYVIGLLLCFFFTGFSISQEQRNAFDQNVRRIDYAALDEADYQYREAEYMYRQSKGWFSCDSICQTRKSIMEDALNTVKSLEKQNEKKLSDAKAQVGIFSEIGVAETRDLFWTRFGQGKQFAQRQTKWDALFMGIGAMRRDETMISFLLRLLISSLFNFTIGMFGTVIGFMWSLYSVIRTYQESILVALPYFAIASLAAISFALTFIIGLYCAAAGTVYVGAKVMASNLRIQGNDPYRQQRVPMGAHTRHHYN